MDRKDNIRRVTDALRALSHEHRLMILGLLSRGERSVGELERLLKLPQPAVSQQLARLRLDNLVETRRDGRTIYYRTSRERLATVVLDLGDILGFDVVERDLSEEIAAVAAERAEQIAAALAARTEEDAETQAVDEPPREAAGMR